MGAAGRTGRRGPHRGPGELAGRQLAGRGASRRGDQGAGRGGHQRGVRRGGRPVPGRARRVLDQRLGDRRPRGLPAGRAGACRPGRGAHRRLRPAAGQGQEPVRRQRPAGRPPARAVHVGAGQARRGGDRALGGPLRGERHQLPGFPGDHGPHRALGRLVPRMGPHRSALRAAGRDRRSGRAAGHRRGSVAARRAVLALGQVRLHRPPGGAAGGARAHRGVLPPRGRPAQPARRAGAGALRGQHAGRVPAGSPWPPSDRDHDSRARLGEGGAAGHRGASAEPWPRGDRDRRARPGGGRVRAADRAGLRAGDHGRGGLPEGTRRRRSRPARRLRGEPGRLLRGQVGGLRAAGAGRRGAGRAVPVGPGLGHAA